MFGNLGEMANLMKQAKQLQDNMRKAQEELAQTEISGESANGLVKAVVTGDFMVKQVIIQRECIDPEEAELLEDLVVAAVNNAMVSAKAKAKEQISEMTGGMNLNIPGLLG